jgi:hypothetical protein
VFGETRLQKLQNRAARNTNYHEHEQWHRSFCSINCKHDALGWKTLKVERKKAMVKMMYKLLNNLGPQSLTNLFTYKGDVTSYNLRNVSSALCLPPPRILIIWKKFYVRWIILLEFYP